MSASDPTPPEAVRRTERSGPTPSHDRRAEVEATAGHIHSVVSLLRELDFGETPPAAAYRAGGEQHDAAV
ncbi:hypothetical protein OG444_33145 [Streptomyces sp. NBC_01232]|uniref:hypothetical protein n=1 Tax=Streptomyces sp. NBC_01232 TaxID=2903786 RepID=UPI002E1045F6|nr:hypothetical protein OG444_33145 [Streptomyces sp. NBC_01232]